MNRTWTKPQPRPEAVKRPSMWSPKRRGTHKLLSWSRTSNCVTSERVAPARDLVKCRESCVTPANVLSGTIGFVHVRVHSNDTRKVRPCGAQQAGDRLRGIRRDSSALRAGIRLLDINKTQTVISPGVVGQQAKCLLAKRDGLIIALLHPLTVANAEVCLTVHLAPDVLLCSAPLAAYPQQETRDVVVHLSRRPRV